MGPLGPRVCYILSGCTEKQSIIRKVLRQRRERGQEDRRDGGKVRKKMEGKERQKWKRTTKKNEGREEKVETERTR